MVTNHGTHTTIGELEWPLAATWKGFPDDGGMTINSNTYTML